MDPNSPPLGIPPLLWVLIFLIGGPGTLGLLLTKTAARIPGWFGAAGRWWQSREPLPASARIDDAEIARLARRYDELAQDAERDRVNHREEMASVRAEVAELKGSLTLSNQRMWAAIGYVRQLVDAIRRLDPEHPIPEPPDRLRDII
ncbi:MAG: hypothetical protein QM658_09695 [Gordonia sp. (in: high G+C Gram-positive bacteria)]